MVAQKHRSVNFEENLSEISDLARSNGTLLYCDGANMNALLGIGKPGEQG